MCGPAPMSAPAAAAAAASIRAPNAASKPPNSRQRDKTMARKQPIELFMPPNMLKAKVGGGPGGMDTAAMSRAEAAMDALQGEFGDWIADDLKTLTVAPARCAATPNAPAPAPLLPSPHPTQGH